MDKEDSYFIGGTLSVLAVLMTGAYWLGVWHERRGYLANYVAQIEAAYLDGYYDCIKGYGLNDAIKEAKRVQSSQVPRRSSP